LIKSGCLLGAAIRGTSSDDARDGKHLTNAACATGQDGRMPRSAPTFRFRSTLYVDLAPGRAYDLLEDIAAYPSWWPQVRSVAKLDEDTALVAARSLLPYTLHFALSPTVRDRAAGTLEAALDGDLVGVCRWDITGAGAGSRLEFAQQVTTPGRVLQATSRVARPVLVLNHRWMMRGARRGLAG